MGNLICYLNHRVPDHFIADFVSFLEHSGNHILRQHVAVDVGNRVVQIWIERLAGLAH